MSGSQYDSTANFALKKPWVEADDDLWGEHWNQNADAIDALLRTVQVAVSISDAPPANPVKGQLWFDSSNPQLYVWYTDGNSAQWVIAVAYAGGLTSDAPSDGQVYGRGGTTPAWVAALPLAGGTMAGPLLYTATGGTTSRSLQDRAADVANVLDYGAGVGGDDAAAIRAAIASGKKVIYVPPGTYTMKSTVPPWGHAADPVCIQVLAATNLTIIAYGATFLVDNSISSPVPATTFAFENNCKHCSLLGGTIVGNATGLTVNQENVAITFTSVTDLTVRDVKVTGQFLTAIAGVYAYDSLFENIQAFNNANAIDVAHLENVTFRGCRFQVNPTHAVTGLNLHYDTPTLIDNAVTNEDGTARSLRGGNANNLRVLDCIFQGFGNGIAIDAIAGCLIARTIVRDGLVASTGNTLSGIYLYNGTAANTAGLGTTNVEITDCDIYGNGVTAGGGSGRGISLNQSGTVTLDKINIINNRIYDNTASGISYLGTPTNIIIAGNDYLSRSGSGVQTAGVSSSLAIALAGGAAASYNVSVPLTVTGQVTVQPPALATTHFDAAQFITSTAQGSGVNGPATAQIGLNINHSKPNYLTTTNVGEIDGLYVTVRQGGPGSDCGAILIDAAGTGSGFLAIDEAVVSKVNSSNTVLQSIRHQRGGINPGTGEHIGELILAQAGALSKAIKIANTPGVGASWTNALEVWNEGTQCLTLSGTTGNVYSLGSFTAAGTSAFVTVQGATAATSSGGAYVMWNKPGGGLSGGTYLLNQKGGGSGGFLFGELDTSGVVTARIYVNSTGGFGCVNGLGVFNAVPPTTKPVVSGAKGSNAALASLLTALAAYGLITDSSTA